MENEQLFISIQRAIESVEEEAERATNLAKLSPTLSESWKQKARELNTAVYLLKGAYGGLAE